MHCYLAQNGLRTFCHKNGIALTAYSPLGRPGQHGDGPLLLEDEAVLAVAKRRGMTPSQVLLRWGMQMGHAVIPKSSSSVRQAENMAAVEASELTEEDMAKLAALERGYRYCPYPAWCRGASCFS